MINYQSVTTVRFEYNNKTIELKYNNKDKDGNVYIRINGNAYDLPEGMELKKVGLCTDEMLVDEAVFMIETGVIC